MNGSHAEVRPASAWADSLSIRPARVIGRSWLTRIDRDRRTWRRVRGLRTLNEEVSLAFTSTVQILDRLGVASRCLRHGHFSPVMLP